MTFHSNLYCLKRAEPLVAKEYTTETFPPPSTKPQNYQILGRLAKRLTKEFRTPVVADGPVLQVLGGQIISTSYEVELEEVGAFQVKVGSVRDRTIDRSQFEDYRKLVHRIVDVALTVLSSDYYKFHPDAPYIIRDEPYFDSELVKMTGIIDSKKYYRGLIMFGDKPYLELNRETELRSYQNLLTEIRCLGNLFEKLSSTPVDFDNPSKRFVEFVSSLLKGKSADVILYPGPRLRGIDHISWSRPSDVAKSVDYMRQNYGLHLTKNQPAVIYRLNREGIDREQVHLPEALSIGHDFEDLERRIPPWQRSSVWTTVQPDCKNQLAKIHELIEKIDSTLRAEFPELYPSLLEFDLQELDVTALTGPTLEVQIQLAEKPLSLSPPYDVQFYRKFSGKNVSFLDRAPSIRVGLLNNSGRTVDLFLEGLRAEYERRNAAQITFSEIKSADAINSKDMDLIMTISDDQDQRTRNIYKIKSQHTLGIPHQHVMVSNAVEDSVMPLVMELTLKLGHNPWILAKEGLLTVTCYGYRPPDEEVPKIFWCLTDGRGRLLRQEGPIPIEKAYDIVETLNSGVISSSFLIMVNGLHQTGFIPTLMRSLKSRYALLEVIDTDNFRLFSTWKPPPVPTFGVPAGPTRRASVEAYETAPQGSYVMADQITRYLMTGRTIERSGVKRGCPTPIKLLLLHNDTEFGYEKLVDYVLNLCFMGRESGHMTRWPMPLYYLHKLARYVTEYGWPHASLKDRPFYV